MQDHQWISKSGRPWSTRVKSDLCRRCGTTPDDHPNPLDMRPESEHNEYCPDGLIEHLADIEAGWTLGKPWKAYNENEAEERNRTEIREMLARWRDHGIGVVTFYVPHVGGENVHTDPWD